MRRRTFVSAAGAVAALLTCPRAVTTARAHTPFQQWVVYRKKHLLIGCHKKDGTTYALATDVVSVLEVHLPAARARIARAPTPGRLASLLGTDQLDVALVADEEAKRMTRGAEEFQPYGAIPLRTLFMLPGYTLIARAAVPDRHAWLIAAALHGSELDLIVANDRDAPVTWHPGAALYRDGGAMP